MRIRPSEAPVLNGRLDDAAWGRATPADAFLQREPQEGQPATERTEVRVLYDDERLYLGVFCYDREPQRIAAKEMRRDAGLGFDDSFAFVLDTFGDRRSAYLFGINPLGARYDATASGVPARDEKVDASWDGLWDVRSEVNGQGWSAEVVIPFKTLRFRRGERQAWGINFRRIIQRRNEEALWCAHRRNQGLTRLVYAGTLVGLSLPSPPSRIETRPYVTAGLQQLAGATDSHQIKGGLDLKYGLTPGLNLDVTFNTVFAQAEVDQNRINLTRFDLFFPEKREFFIEGAERFSFGEAGKLQPFHSRRIGLSPDRRQIPILAGARLTGKVGRTSLGTLAMQTRVGQGEPATLFSAVRVRQDVLSQSSVGFLLADREPFDGSPNRSFGADFTFATSRLPGNRNLTLSGYLFGTQTPGTPDGWAGSLLVDYPNDLWRVKVRHTEIQKDLNPEMGFVKRRDIRQTSGEVKAGPRPRIPGVRQLFFKVKFDYLFDRHNILQNRDFEFRLLGVDTRWGDKFELNFQPKFERLDDDFEIVRGVVIPSGKYAFNQWEIRWEMSDRRPVSPKIKFQRGAYFTGRRTAYEAEGRIKFGSHLSLNTAYNRNDIRLSEASFATHEWSSRVSYAVTTSLAARAFAQWNSEDDEINLNLRLSFLPGSGSTVFLVYNHLWGRDASGWRIADRAALLKTVYLLKL